MKAKISPDCLSKGKKSIHYPIASIIIFYYLIITETILIAIYLNAQISKPNEGGKFFDRCHKGFGGYFVLF